MRNRALLVIAALLTLPTLATAQGVRRPVPRRGTQPEPAPLPPTAAPIARALEYKRSRWSAEGYSLISGFDVPAPNGGSTHYTAIGTGTHGDYRYTDHFTATVDMTASFLGSPTTTETAEVGTRYSPLSWDYGVRPFVDVRAAYMRMYDTFATPSEAAVIGGATGDQLLEDQRYSRGLGGVAGAGLEISLTRMLAVTTELSTLRNRMTTYRVTGPGSIPTGTSYWMTSYRYAIGLKFSPVRTLRLAQNPGA